MGFHPTGVADGRWCKPTLHLDAAWPPRAARRNPSVIHIPPITSGVGQRIDVIDLSDDGMGVDKVETMSLPMASGRFRSVVLGPDGSLYAAVDGGDIHKLTPGN